MSRSGIRVLVEGLWQTDMGPVITQRFIYAASPLTAIQRAETEDPDTDWFFACRASEMDDLRAKRERAFDEAVRALDPFAPPDDPTNVPF